MLKSHTLPDVASSHTSENPLSLQWVGMDGIAIPLALTCDAGTTYSVNALADLYVSLDSENVKGIHMSRLYTQLNKLAGENISQEMLGALLDGMVISQEGISHSSKVNLSFDLTIHKPALLSSESGYQAYPVVITAEADNSDKRYAIELTIPYSSTCPCSASLSRRLFHDTLDHYFNSETIDKSELLHWVQNQAGSVATPHSQRSYAYIQLVVDQVPDIPSVIRQLEEVLGTPVQTAVKREDELEFARLNAENLMFCEDAARKIKRYLNSQDWAKDYEFKVEHQESLHAHNAVVVDRKFA